MNKSITLTETELKVLLDLLDLTKEYFYNRSCNDYSLPNTKEAWDIIEKYEQYNSGGKDLEKRPKGKEIHTADFIMCSYFIAKLEGNI